MTVNGAFFCEMCRCQRCQGMGGAHLKIQNTLQCLSILCGCFGARLYPATLQGWTAHPGAKAQQHVPQSNASCIPFFGCDSWHLRHSQLQERQRQLTALKGKPVVPRHGSLACTHVKGTLGLSGEAFLPKMITSVLSYLSRRRPARNKGTCYFIPHPSKRMFAGRHLSCNPGGARIGRQGRCLIGGRSTPTCRLLHPLERSEDIHFSIHPKLAGFLGHSRAKNSQQLMHSGTTFEPIQGKPSWEAAVVRETLHRNCLSDNGIIHIALPTAFNV
jgi:hypothetical protein